VAGPVEDGLAGKTIVNLLGILRKAMEDAIAEAFLEGNLVRKLKRRTQVQRALKKNSKPLTRNDRQ
jgi:hypothetical protein